MTIYQSVTATAARPAVIADDSDVVSVSGKFTVPASNATVPLAATDVIQLVKIPVGAKIIDAVVHSVSGLGGVANVVELTNTAGAVVAGSTIVAAGSIAANTVVRLNSVAALNLIPQAVENFASVVLGAASSATTGDIITLEVRYRNSSYGD